MTSGEDARVLPESTIIIWKACEDGNGFGQVTGRYAARQAATGITLQRELAERKGAKSLRRKRRFAVDRDIPGLLVVVPPLMP